MLDSFINFLETTGVARLFASADWWKTAIMFVIAGVLIYLAIAIVWIIIIELINHLIFKHALCKITVQGG